MTTQYEPVTGTAPDPEVQHEARTMRRHLEGGELHMMTEIGDGVFVQWSQCAACSQHVTDCGCKGGPREPDYMSRWRNQRFQQSFAERGIEPRATPYKVKELMEEAQEAADAAYGDSNDTEIDLLRGVAEFAMSLLGLKFPEGRDPDDEPEDEPEGDEEGEEDERPSAAGVTARTPEEAVEKAAIMDAGYDAALARVKEDNSDVGF